ncbi:venom dipeptidyl peptidase 4-like isoform X2 [Cylas formicarius]|uniref:venom dipeptidyl peptidase 4-like isoform X2 n=1 Tax=Cylas formicarius TaxID=197179 RepID=UPI002958D004|nr:venom dipeptidyl peptidase 4-like isoform X2 [Cylas formicarius]
MVNRDIYGNYVVFDVSTKVAALLLNGTVLASYTSPSISLSNDGTYVLIRHNETSVFRHSTTAQYTLLEITTGKTYEVNSGNPIQLAKFDNTGHGFAYVVENSIHYVPEASNVDSPELVASGEPGVIYCGVPDWVYEEEVFGGDSAMWFSPDGKKLAYAVFNDTNVLDFSYFVYGTPGSLDDQYPTLTTIKYPKVGTPNPLVKTFVYDIDSKRSTEFTLISSINNSVEDNDYVLYDLSWVSDQEIAMISTNRVQNESVIIRCKIDGNCSEEASYRQENGWLRPKIPHYSQNGSLKIEILPQPQDGDFFEHLVLTNIANNSSLRLTYGNRVVTAFYGWDEAEELVYYVASVNATPSQQHVYAVNTANINDDKCLTCNMVVDGEECKYAKADFSKDYSYLAKICQGPAPIYVTVDNIKNNTDSIVWQNNTYVRDQISRKLLPSTKDLTVPIEGNFAARVRLLLPPNFDEATKYPAIVYVYGGPESSSIADTYSSGMANYFVTNRSYIYIYIDGRGSDRDGDNKMFEIYRKLGTVEIEDQINVTRYLQQTYPFIDPSNTGIWGWSYGGFASTWALAKDSRNVFKFALAVAPVTSFIYYDTIYTERYMGLPTEEDNLLGYNNTDLTRKVEALRNRLYFVIHGNADDNVHYQQTMLLVKALEVADIDFLQQSYPDENHSLGNVYPHLYHTLDSFFASSFGLS